MGVRWRPAGFDCRPGVRVSTWFENEVTRKKGIPPKKSVGTVAYHHGRTVFVHFDGTDHRASMPGFFLGPEDETLAQSRARRDALVTDEWWLSWLRSGKQHNYDAWYDDIIRSSRTWPINPDLLDRAIARYGPRDHWKRAWDNWMARAR